MGNDPSGRPPRDRALRAGLVWTLGTGRTHYQNEPAADASRLDITSPPAYALRSELARLDQLRRLSNAGGRIPTLPRSAGLPNFAGLRTDGRLRFRLSRNAGGQPRS